jgi:F0F1-type ATP synthase assembly protein I
VIPKHRHPWSAEQEWPVASQGLGWSSLLSMGLVTGVVIVLGFGAGLLVDNLANTAPVFLLVGLALGIVGAAAYLVNQFRTYLRN